MSFEAYSLDMHRHYFAVWVAGRATSRGTHLSVEVCKNLLESCGINEKLHLVRLGTTEHDFDKWHSKKCGQIKKKSDKHIHFGGAAKMLNVYLKARFVCAENSDSPAIGWIHPPIDRLMLKKLAKCNVGGRKKEWRRFSKIGWSKFQRNEYRQLVNLIRECLERNPMWKVEMYWPIYE